MAPRALDPRHAPITARLLVESLAGLLLLATATLLIDRSGLATRGPWLAALILCQGCWLHRLYVVAHEASHRKLWPGNPRLNDLLGQALLLTLMLPLRIHRKIHAFHHGQNRRDHHTSALDTFVIEGPATPLRRAWCHLLWYVAVFGGGFFVHSLISVVLFLAMPLRLARRISPAFRGWTHADQLRSLAAFGLGLSVHLGVGLGLGVRAWALTLGWPLLAFAWVYSLLVYIYHYDTGYGPAVREHVRSLRPHPLASWWLLNFNEHGTHHKNPKLPWYQLPHREGPDAGERATIGAAILAQLRGPRIIECAGQRAGDRAGQRSEG